MASTYVDARFAGGAIVVSGGTYLDAPVVDLAVPGLGAVPLRPHEAHALARELHAYSAAADKRLRSSQKDAHGAGATAPVGDDQNPGKD